MLFYSRSFLTLEYQFTGWLSSAVLGDNLFWKQKRKYLNPKSLLKENTVAEQTNRNIFKRYNKSHGVWKIKLMKGKDEKQSFGLKAQGFIVVSLLFLGRAFGWR
jgi:hypothetical protein